MSEHEAVLIAALERIRDLKPEPYVWPEGWAAEQATCAECKRWESHPIQRGICDTHRKPFYERERHDEFEAKAIGIRAILIADEALRVANSWTSETDMQIVPEVWRDKDRWIARIDYFEEGETREEALANFRVGWAKFAQQARPLVPQANEHPTIFKTIVLAGSLHWNQFDKAGVPYIAHPLAVMRRVSEPARHVAVLHDVLEDCDITSEALRSLGYTDLEIRAIETLTRRGGETYENFISGIIASHNGLAIEVKMADIEDNLDPSRAVLRGADAILREDRYRAAHARLRNVVEARP